VSSRGYLFLYIHSCTFDLKRTYDQFWDSSESDENDVSSVEGEFVFRIVPRRFSLKLLTSVDGESLLVE
jgi:hypothetical protein